MPDPSSNSGGGDAVVLDHWIFGRPKEEGYRVMAVSKNLNLNLYEAPIARHYTPLRGIVSNTVDQKDVDIRMVHPIPGGEEVLVSVLNRGLPDGAGRETYRNHTVIVPISLLRDSRISIPTVVDAAKAFDKASPGISGEIEPLVIPLQPAQSGTFGVGLRNHVSKAAIETLVYRYTQERDSKTLLYCPRSEDPDRVTILYLLLEVMCWGSGIQVPVAISDSPPPSQLDPFQIVISSKGVHGDPSRWAIIEASMDQPQYPRHPSLTKVYDILDKAYQSAPRIVQVSTPAPAAPPADGAQKPSQ
jgi:hypothetical protein